MKAIIKKIVFVIFIISAGILYAQETTEPTLITNSPTTVTSTSAILHGSATAGSESITERGFQWKNAEMTSWTKQAVTSEGNIMEYAMTGMTPDMSYTYRPYAVAAGQTYYGEPYTFKTKSTDYESGSNLDLMMDVEGNFTGWKARTGNYTTGSGTTKPPFKFNKSYDNPTTATSGSVKYFVLNTDTTKYDEKSKNGLKKIPSHLGYERSIRFGNTNSGGDCSELSYRLDVNTSNCLVTFNFAMVIETPHPGDKFNNPTFEIDVINDETEELVEECAFFQMCGDLTTSNMPDGWHAGTTGWAYCDWQQIKVNLALFDGQKVRIRARVSGCTYGAHGGYGYFVAKTDEPSIYLAGCAGAGDTVNKGEAPAGFDKYEWFSLSDWTQDQQTLASMYDNAISNNGIISTDSILAITTPMMNDEPVRYFAVKLTSPTQHVKWDKEPAPACDAYIPIQVSDMRPDFSMQTINKYIPVDPESDKDEIGFLFTDVKERSATFPMDWQIMDFGDGKTLEFKYNETTAKWYVDESLTPLASNKCRVTYSELGTLDTIFHEYNPGDYVYKRTAHSYSVSNDLTCEKTEPLDVHVGVRPQLVLISPDTICVNESATFEATSPGNDSENYLYEWWHGSDDVETTEPFFKGTTFTIDNLDKDTIFHVKVTNPDGNNYRWAWDTVIVQAFPDITIDGDSIICIGQNVKLTAEDMGGSTLGMKWTYQRPTASTIVGAGSNPANFNQAVKQDTTLYILAETTRHCIAWDSINITVVIPQVTADKKSICPGEEVTLTGSGATTYSWTASPEDATLTAGVQIEEPVTVSPTETTTYTMAGYGSNGCVATTGLTITVIPYPVPKISYNPQFVDMEEPTLLITDSSLYAHTSNWTFSDGGTAMGRTVTYSFHDLSSENVTVYLTSSNELGCSASTEVTIPIVLFAVWMPTGFAPDGDGMNDYYFFMTENDLYDVKFEIYNRWGTKMYSYSAKHYEHVDATDVQKYGWDGKYNDEYVQNGTYVWRLSYKREGSTKVYDRTGTISLIR